MGVRKYATLYIILRSTMKTIILIHCILLDNFLSGFKTLGISLATLILQKL